MAKTHGIVMRLGYDVLFQLVRKLVHIARIHQILPYNESVTVAKLVKGIRRIITAAPYADRIVICSFGTAEQHVDTLLCNTGIDTVFRNIISSL